MPRSLQGKQLPAVQARQLPRPSSALLRVWTPMASSNPTVIFTAAPTGAPLLPRRLRLPLLRQGLSRLISGAFASIAAARATSPSIAAQAGPCALLHPALPAITEAESALFDAVTITILGSRPPVSRAQLAELIASRFDILEDLYDVYDFASEDFLTHFTNNTDRNKVLSVSGVISAPDFKFTAKPWTRQAHTRASMCHYRVIVDIRGMPANAPCLGTVSSILAPCCIFDRILTDRFDRFKFWLAVWTLDPTTIPFASILFVQEPNGNTAGDDTELRLLNCDIDI
ncbi:hypothetical protein ACQ4PT_043145 [Festuca glaucescens]